MKTVLNTAVLCTFLALTAQGVHGQTADSRASECVRKLITHIEAGSIPLHLIDIEAVTETASGGVYRTSTREQKQERQAQLRSLLSTTQATLGFEFNFADKFSYSDHLRGWLIDSSVKVLRKGKWTEHGYFAIIRPDDCAIKQVRVAGGLFTLTDWVRTELKW